MLTVFESAHGEPILAMKRMPRQIPGYSHYWAIDTGVIIGARGKPLCSYTNRGGYLMVILYQDGVAKQKQVHRLILEAFVGPCPDDMECCHNNGVATDNRLSNLRWDTHSENMKDKFRHDDQTHVGTHNSRCKLTENDVRMIIYMFRTGEFTQKEIAGMHGMDHSNVCCIVNKRSWKHIWRHQ